MILWILGVAVPLLRRPNPADVELVVRALAGDSKASRTLTRRLIPVVRARTRRVLDRQGRSRDGVDDLAQDVWLWLIDRDGRALRGYDPERGKTLEGYVGLLTERQVLDRLRVAGAQKRGAGITHADVDDTPIAAIEDPETRAIAQDLAARLGEHLQEALPPKGRLVYRYAWQDGLRPDEIARLMNVDRQVVYNWQHKVRATVRSFLAANGVAQLA